MSLPPIDTPFESHMWLVSQVGVWYEVPTRPSRSDFENPTRDLQDLVKMCNMAARHNRGDILWVSYQCSDADAKKNNREKPQFGNLAWAMTARGAAAVLARFPVSQGSSSSSTAPANRPVVFVPAANPSGGPPARAEPSAALAGGGSRRGGPVGRLLEFNHWDIAMRKLIEEPEGEVLRAGYVYPPVGNFARHPGSFDKAYEKEGRRPCWHQTWCVEGTRPEEDRHDWRRRRWVYGYNEKGHPTHVGEIQAVDGDSQWWRSFWRGPPDDRPMPQEEFRQRPQTATRNERRRAAAKAKAAARPQVPPPPASSLTPTGGVVPHPDSGMAKLGPPPAPPPPSPRMAAQIAVTEGHPPPDLTGRQGRLARDLELQRGRRLWVDTEAEASSLGRNMVDSIFDDSFCRFRWSMLQHTHTCGNPGAIRSALHAFQNFVCYQADWVVKTPLPRLVAYPEDDHLYYARGAGQPLVRDAARA